jgi:spore maturation protein CgeB
MFAEALEASAAEHGHAAHFLDDVPFFGSLGTTMLHRAVRRAAGHPLTVRRYNRHICLTAHSFTPDVAIIVKGSYVSIDTLAHLRALGVLLVNVATDDPFNAASTRTPWVRQGIPYYDLYCSTKRAIMGDVERAGCRVVQWLPFGYKPTAHFPEVAANSEERERFSSDVVFIGGADAERLPFFTALVEAIPDLRLHLYGGYWDRHPVLRTYERGFVRGRDYRLAMAGAKIAVNLVRRMNRDGHVMRSFEAPACGAFMLAERTAEHADMLEEDQEMVCFGSIGELISKVKEYLPQTDRRKAIAEAGHARITSGSNTYSDRLEAILGTVRSMIEERRLAAPAP